MTAESDVSTVVALVGAGPSDPDARPVVLLAGAGPGDPGTEPGVVLLVGAGPGDPDLLSLDAEAALRGSREVVADRSLAPLLETLVAEAESGAEAEVRAAAGVEPRARGVHADLAAAGHPASADRVSTLDQTDPGVSAPAAAGSIDPSAVAPDGAGVGTEGSHGGVRPIGGTADASLVSWVDDDRAASAHLLAAVRRGPGVVRLYRGDPWFHPAGDVERAALRTGGHRFDLVPGVVEELAVLAAIGIPVQVRTLAVTTTFVTHDPLGSAGETARSALPGTGRTATGGSANRSGRSTSDKPSAVMEAPAVPADAAHTLVVRTTDVAATSRWLADGARRSGVVLDRPAAAVAIGPGDHQLGEVTRATLVTLAARAPAQPGVVVVGLVAALDTTEVRPSVAGHLPRSACETGRDQALGTSRTEAVAPADRSAAATGPDRAPGTSRTGELCSDGSVAVVGKGSTEHVHRPGAGR